MTTQTSTLLKFANLHLAAESLFGITPNDLLGAVRDNLAMTDARLKLGNTRSSRFTDAQAAEFSQLWEVVEHKSNTATGFSAELQGQVLHCSIAA